MFDWSCYIAMERTGWKEKHLKKKIREEKVFPTLVSALQDQPVKCQCWTKQSMAVGGGVFEWEGGTFQTEFTAKTSK